MACNLVLSLVRGKSAGAFGLFAYGGEPDAEGLSGELDPVQRVGRQPDKDSQTRLREDIRDAQREDGMHAYLLSSTTFLLGCISESSRLKPLAAFSVPQSGPINRVLEGYPVPAGTNYVVDTYAFNIRNEFWGPYAKEYRPSRFLEVNGTKVRYNFWRFGFRPRQCMGK
ncbi:uncharacterized protein ATNIH1004_007754 [Aspergillus tanneri]|uniref:Uncharacterized protein n=1 Tax=Aspergillus tanneri TaxID=1220188 RepID=A0A5M9MV10_9EURO|nr:uncharacterized protein ATNIH1004_007754 [Aspergillus tanneri]KAA8646327.1 hypothetical protein ATNIH1004_007754 [Aspergillus tanneri]